MKWTHVDTKLCKSYSKKKNGWRVFPAVLTHLTGERINKIIFLPTLPASHSCTASLQSGVHLRYSAQPQGTGGTAVRLLCHHFITLKHTIVAPAVVRGVDAGIPKKYLQIYAAALRRGGGGVTRTLCSLKHHRRLGRSDECYSCYSWCLPTMRQQ